MSDYEKYKEFANIVIVRVEMTKVLNSPVNYKIYRENSKIGCAPDVIGPFIFGLFWAIIFVRNVFSWGVISIPLLFTIFSIFWLIWRLFPWKHPLEVTWSERELRLRLPSGRRTVVAYDKVETLSIEGGKRFDWVKKVLPTLWLGRFSLNALLWIAYSGRFYLTNLAFVHLRTKTNKWILVPIPAKQLPKIVEFLKTMPLSKESLTIEPLISESSKKIIYSTVILAVISTALGIAVIFISPNNQSTIPIVLVLLSIMVGSILVLCFYQFYLLLSQRKVILGGYVLMGRWAYLAGFFFLIVGILTAWRFIPQLFIALTKNFF